MKYSLSISNFLEEFSRLSYSIVFLYLFALITEEGFLISPCYSLELCEFKWEYLSFFPLFFTSLHFRAICKASSDNHFAFLHFFVFDMVLTTDSCIVLWIFIHSSSDTFSAKSSPLSVYLSLPVCNHKGIDLSHMGMSSWFSLLSSI